MDNLNMNIKSAMVAAVPLLADIRNRIHACITKEKII